MPPPVYLHKRAGVPVSYIIKRRNSSKVLCKITATKADVWEAFEREVADTGLEYTVSRLVIDYLGSQKLSIWRHARNGTVPVNLNLNCLVKCLAK
jgi:hypothetical protein